MPFSMCDLSMLSDAEARQLRVETLEWSRTLRLGMAALVNRRMANLISHEEYATSRKAGLDDRAECDRRMAILGR